MSHFIRRLPILAAALLVAGAAEAQPPASRLGGGASIADVRQQGREWDTVTLEGEVVRMRSQKLFEIEDATGKMLVLIPEHLRRELGDPKIGERIRVRGKYDHKALDQGVWGLRVEAMERDRPEALPTPVAEAGPAPERVKVPAAPASAAPFSIQAAADRDLVEELRLAKERVTASRELLVDAEVAYMRGLSAKLPESEISVLADAEASAGAALDELLEPVPALIDEARAAGVSPGLIRMYEASIYRQR